MSKKNIYIYIYIYINYGFKPCFPLTTIFDQYPEFPNLVNFSPFSRALPGDAGTEISLLLFVARQRIEWPLAVLGLSHVCFLNPQQNTLDNH